MPTEPKMNESRQVKRATFGVGSALLAVGIGLVARMAGATWPATGGVVFLVWGGVVFMVAVGLMEATDAK